MFRFTIRELVLLTVVVALGVGWWVERRQHATAKRRLAAREAEASRYGEALSQTGLAIYELGIHWNSINGKIVLRPTRPDDGAPAKGLKGDPPLVPNFDISHFGGQRMPGAAEAGD
jgi:hypothetical protein